MLFTGHDKKQQKYGLFFFIVAKSNFKTKGKVIHMWIICAPICMRASKKGFFLHVWLSKVLLLEITLANKTKNNFKINFFFLVWTAKQCQQKKNKMLGLSLPLFQNKSKNNRSPALAFVFLNKQPKSCFVYKWEKFFFLCIFHLPENKAPNRQIVFYFCKQNHFEMRNRNQAKKKLNWSFCFFVDSFCLLPPQAKQKNALLQKWGDNSDDNHSASNRHWFHFSPLILDHSLILYCLGVGFFSPIHCSNITFVIGFFALFPLLSLKLPLAFSSFWSICHWFCHWLFRPFRPSVIEFVIGFFVPFVFQALNLLLFFLSLHWFWTEQFVSVFLA